MTASIVPGTGESECAELSDSSDDIDLQSNDIECESEPVIESHSDKNNTDYPPPTDQNRRRTSIDDISVDNSQLGVKASSDVARGRGVTVSDDNGCNTLEIVADDDVPSASLVSYPNAAYYCWRRHTPLPVKTQFSGDDFPDPPGAELIPWQYSDQFFNSDLSDKIANETNLYSVQTSEKSINTSAMEIVQYIRIITQMGILNYPQYRMCWDPTSRIPVIANVMGLTRFEILKLYFHVNDNSEQPARCPDFDQLYKVCPLIDSILTSCHKIPQEQNHSTDKQVIPTKGR